ncbi:MAG TPA: RNase adapter RapZ [Chitinophagaceae bacterium]|jgi:aminoglycoside/choline kinase family phosphotransferase
MQKILEGVRDLFATYSKEEIVRLEKLPQSGSDRNYFRITTANGTCIATYNHNVKENNTFIKFSEHFRSCGCPVPRIFVVNEEQSIYLQEDFGDESLLSKLEKHGYNDYVYGLFQQSLRELAKLQITGGAGIDYNLCLTAREFGKQAILSDLLYFKYYFLDTLKYAYDKQALLDDFEALSNYLTHTENKHFMFRDFQSRNVMVKDDKVYFIDYQGGMRGALQYDVASLLWQARAELPDDWKRNLLDYYIDQANLILENPADKVIFTSQYNGYVLIRLLQVLGAYGFRGLFERKAQFLTSIPLALRNMKWFTDNGRMGIAVPEFDKCLRFCVSDEVINRFEPPRATDATPLAVTISSFSYRNGVPAGDPVNGGGFVFDCRGLLNPGRFDEYKKLTGRDKSVKDFLEQQTRMPEFLNSVFDVVDITVTDYLKRNFESLTVSFGCTGGQHRSVYAADALARHLRNKFGVKTEVKHLVQDAKNWINE